MVALKGDKEIRNKIIGRLAEADGLEGVIDQADFNDGGKLGSGKEMQDRLSKLIATFAPLAHEEGRYRTASVEHRRWWRIPPYRGGRQVN